jgi:hypothetical protein
MVVIRATEYFHLSLSLCVCVACLYARGFTCLLSPTQTGADLISDPINDHPPSLPSLSFSCLSLSLFLSFSLSLFLSFSLSLPRSLLRHFSSSSTSHSCLDFSHVSSSCTRFVCLAPVCTLPATLSISCPMMLDPVRCRTCGIPYAIRIRLVFPHPISLSFLFFFLFLFHSIPIVPFFFSHFHSFSFYPSRSPLTFLGIFSRKKSTREMQS